MNPDSGMTSSSTNQEQPVAGATLPVVDSGTDASTTNSQESQAQDLDTNQVVVSGTDTSNSDSRHSQAQDHNALPLMAGHVLFVNPFVEQDIFRLYQGIQQISTIPQMTETIRFMAASYSGVVYTGSGSEVVLRRWHEEQQGEPLVCSKGPIHAMALQFTNERTCAFFAHNRGVVKVWRSDGPEEGLPAKFSPFRILRRWKDLLPWRNPIQNAITALCVSDDNRFLYAATHNTLNTWSISNSVYKLVDRIKEGTVVITALEAGPGVVVSASTEGLVKIRRRVPHGRKEDGVRHRLVAVLNMPTPVPPAVKALLFHTVDGVRTWLYAGLSDGNVRCWPDLTLSEADADCIPDVMHGHEGAVTSLVCSERFIFSGSEDGTIRAWRRIEKTHTIALRLQAHPNTVTCLIVQKDWEQGGDGRCILYSASEDRTLKIWRVQELPPINAGQ